VPRKELFVDGDVLDGHQAVTRLMLDDGVNEHGRIAIAQAIERLRYVDGHSCQSTRTPAAPRDRGTRPRRVLSV
jgi:protein-disulfide isomerase-like protein with CxxC motif